MNPYFKIIKQCFYDIYELEKACTQVAKLGLFVKQQPPKFHLLPIELYQDMARIYLDEFQVEEWDYLPLFDNTILMNRFMVKE